MAPSLPNKYIPAEHENAVRSRWDASGAFHADPASVLNGSKQPYAIFIPPPNVTDRLHLGHALNNTLQDVQARAHRMMGYETLWMPGTDHAGIATQTVVEKRVLKETGRKRTDFPRDEFVAKIQAFKDEYEAIITDQLKAMGCSCDWQRQRFTMDPVCARAVREAFFRLFSDGLIYRGKRLVNWDPVTQTALADDEVDMEEVDGHFYYLRYPLCHGRDGAGHGNAMPVTWDELKRRGYPGAMAHADSDPAWITVATTRPETYLGDSAVAVNPKDPRAKALRGLHVELPLVDRIIPILEDDYVVLPASMQEDPEAAKSDPKAVYATGFLKVTPAHDPNDYEIGRRHAEKLSHLPNAGVINVMAPDASISDKHGWTDVGSAHLFVGLSREAARKKVIEEFKARNLLEQIKPYRHSVGHSYRSHAAIEPYLSDQWYVKVTDDRLAGAANRALGQDQQSTSPERKRAGSGAAGHSRPAADVSGSVPTDGHLRFHPDRYAKTYESWHDNIRDWCISRQLWWGHRIPVWFHATATPPSTLSSEAVSIQRTENGTFVCVRSLDDAATIATLSGAGFAQDQDVLDTWFSSALWPMSTLGWPEPPAEMKGLLEAFNPSNVLCTAREIITLWVSRMVMFNRYLLGEGQGNGPLPFKDVFIHSVIQDGEGRKMSKSLGNGVNPLDIIQSHGSDAMRFTLCKMTTNTQDVRLPVVFDKEKNCNTSPKFDEGRNFVTKLFNAAKFAMMNLEEPVGQAPSPPSKSAVSLADRWMLSRLARVTQKVNAAIESYDYSGYAEAVYQLLWWDFCDWYVEAIKPTVKSNPVQQAVLRHVLDAILRLLHPICPYVTEVLFDALKAYPRPAVPGLSLNGSHRAGVDMLCVTDWPRIDAAALIDEPAEKEFEHLRALVEAIRVVRSNQVVEPRRKVTLHTDAATAAAITAGSGLVETLAGIEKVLTIAPGERAPGGAAFAFDGREHALSNLKEALDPAVEMKLLGEQSAKLEQAISTLEARLANPGYAERAPAKMVNETREQLAQKIAERDALRKRLAELG